MKADRYTWLDGIRNIDPTAKFILHHLLSVASRQGLAWMSVDTLVLKTNAKERTVQYKLAELKRLNLIAETGRFHRSKGTRYPLYRVAPGEDQLFAADSRADQGADPAPRIRAKPHPAARKSLHPHREKKGDKSSNELKQAREDSLFDQAFAAYPECGRARTNEPAARELWEEHADRVGEVELLAAVRAANAAPKGTYGLPGMQKWLAERRYLSLLGLGGVVQVAAPKGPTAATAGVQPRDEAFHHLRTTFVGIFGELKAASILDHCKWDSDERTLRTRTLYAYELFRDHVGREFVRNTGVRIICPNGSMPDIC